MAAFQERFWACIEPLKHWRTTNFKTVVVRTWESPRLFPKIGEGQTVGSDQSHDSEDESMSSGSESDPESDSDCAVNDF